MFHPTSYNPDYETSKNPQHQDNSKFYNPKPTTSKNPDAPPLLSKSVVEKAYESFVVFIHKNPHLVAKVSMTTLSLIVVALGLRKFWTHIKKEVEKIKTKSSPRKSPSSRRSSHRKSPSSRRSSNSRKSPSHRRSSHRSSTRKSPSHRRSSHRST